MGFQDFYQVIFVLKKGSFSVNRTVCTVSQINLLHGKIFWSTGFSEFQPIKMYSTDRQHSIVIGQKFGKPVAP